VLRRRSGELNGLFVALMAALAGVVIGSIAPWVTVSGLINLSRGGLDAGDGWISLVAALLCTPLLWRQATQDGFLHPLLVLALCLGAAAVAIVDIRDVQNTADLSQPDLKLVSVDPGWGIYLVVGCAGLAALLATGLTIDAVQDRRRARRQARRRAQYDEVSDELVLLASVLGDEGRKPNAGATDRSQHGD
jgi:hypothetical protein